MAPSLEVQENWIQMQCTDPILNYDPTYPGNEIYVEENVINNSAGYNTSQSTG